MNIKVEVAAEVAPEHWTWLTHIYIIVLCFVDNNNCEHAIQKKYGYRCQPSGNIAQ